MLKSNDFEALKFNLKSVKLRHGFLLVHVSFKHGCRLSEQGAVGSELFDLNHEAVLGNESVREHSRGLVEQDLGVAITRADVGQKQSLGSGLGGQTKG